MNFLFLAEGEAGLGLTYNMNRPTWVTCKNPFKEMRIGCPL